MYWKSGEIAEENIKGTEKLTDKSYFLSEPVCIFPTREKFTY